MNKIEFSAQSFDLPICVTHSRTLLLTTYLNFYRNLIIYINRLSDLVAFSSCSLWWMFWNSFEKVGRLWSCCQWQWRMKTYPQSIDRSWLFKVMLPDELNIKIVFVVCTFQFNIFYSFTAIRGFGDTIWWRIEQQKPKKKMNKMSLSVNFYCKTSVYSCKVGKNDWKWQNSKHSWKD